MIIRLLDRDCVYENELPGVEEAPETILFGERVFVSFGKNPDGKECYRRSTSIHVKRVTIDTWSGGVDRYTVPTNRLSPEEFVIGPTVRREDLIKPIIGVDWAKPGGDLSRDVIQTPEGPANRCNSTHEGKRCQMMFNHSGLHHNEDLEWGADEWQEEQEPLTEVVPGSSIERLLPRPIIGLQYPEERGIGSPGRCLMIPVGGSVPVPPDAFPRLSPEPEIAQPEAINRINEVS